MKRSIQFLAIFITLSGLLSCNKSDDSTPTPIIVTFNATLNGASEVPTTTSTATGTAVLKFNKTTKTFSLTVTYSGLTPSGGHIHKGAVGVDGPIVFPLPDLTSPITYTSVALNATEEADLIANLYYVNLHTTAFPGGEIRGQLVTTNPSGTGGGGGGGGY
ncbi:CHRD domain-containing protein [Flavobacterium sp. LB3P122]|uniref:CHRD domain-containing protein n=1 Tax=Flavobacterium algoriphilum TaxID=3398738 RepID=UPI003A839DDC